MAVSACAKPRAAKGAIVFVGRQARKAIAAYLRSRTTQEPAEPLWLAFNKGQAQQRLRYEGLRDIVRRRAEQANIPTPTLHSFRRSFAITMLRSGADLISLSRLMGHGSLPILQRYLKQLKEDLGEVHAQHSPADSLL